MADPKSPLDFSNFSMPYVPGQQAPATPTPSQPAQGGGLWDWLNKPLQTWTAEKGKEAANAITDPNNKPMARAAQVMHDAMLPAILQGIIRPEHIQGFVGGATQGAGQLASYQSSPLALALTASSGGAGLAEKAGLAGTANTLRSLPKVIGVPTVLHGARNAIAGAIHGNLPYAGQGLAEAAMGGLMASGVYGAPAKTAAEAVAPTLDSAVEAGLAKAEALEYPSQEAANKAIQDSGLPGEATPLAKGKWQISLDRTPQPPAESDLEATTNAGKTTMIRHGDTDMNGGGKGIGSADVVRSWQDIPLNDKGRAAAAEAGDAIAPLDAAYPHDKIVTSDLDRAQETAQIVKDKLGRDIPIVVDPRLKPWNLGDIGGTPTEQALPKMHYLMDNPDTPAPNGESFNQYIQRILPALKEYHEEDAHNILIGHTRTMAAMDALAKNEGDLNIPYDVFKAKHPVEPGGIAFIGNDWDMQYGKTPAKSVQKTFGDIAPASLESRLQESLAGAEKQPPSTETPTYTQGQEPDVNEMAAAMTQKQRAENGIQPQSLEQRLQASLAQVRPQVGQRGAIPVYTQGQEPNMQDLTAGLTPAQKAASGIPQPTVPSKAIAAAEKRAFPQGQNPLENPSVLDKLPTVPPKILDKIDNDAFAGGIPAAVVKAIEERNDIRLPQIPEKQATSAVASDTGVPPTPSVSEPVAPSTTPPMASPGVAALEKDVFGTDNPLTRRGTVPTADINAAENRTFPPGENPLFTGDNPQLGLQTARIAEENAAAKFWALRKTLPANDPTVRAAAEDWVASRNNTNAFVDQMKAAGQRVTKAMMPDRTPNAQRVSPAFSPNPQAGGIDPKTLMLLAQHVAGGLAGVGTGASIGATPEDKKRDALLLGLAGAIAPYIARNPGVIGKWYGQGLLTKPITAAIKLLGDQGAVLGEALEGGVGQALKNKSLSSGLDYAGNIVKNFYSKPTLVKAVESFKSPTSVAAATKYSNTPLFSDIRNPLSWVGRALGGTTEATQDALMRAGKSYEDARDLTFLGTPQDMAGNQKGALAQGMRAIAALPSKLKLQIPFARIGSNLFMKGLDRTPGLALRYLADPAVRNDPEMLGRILAATTTGAGAVGAGYALSPDGKTNSPERRLLAAAAGPYALPLELGMGIHDAMQAGKGPNIPSEAIKAAMDTVSQRQPLPERLNPLELLRMLAIPRSVADTTAWYDQGGQIPFDLGQVNASGAVPGRKTNIDLLDRIAADIPGMRQDLPPAAAKGGSQLDAYLKQLMKQRPQ